jgi:hypothetical protein
MPRLELCDNQDVENGDGPRPAYFRDAMLNYPMGFARHGEAHRIPPAKLIVELSQAQLERLDEASGGLGPAGFVRVVALKLADEAAAIQCERRRAAFADES